MKNKSISVICTAVILVFSMPANADSTLHIYQCELRDGKSLADVAAASAKWIASLRSVGAGEEARVSLESPMASPLSENTFNFVISVADTKAWGEFWTNAYGDELVAANAEWSEVASCDAGSIWNSFDIE